jgi:RNA polymerase sigma factor (sigma-70 family)
MTDPADRMLADLEALRRRGCAYVVRRTGMCWADAEDAVADVIIGLYRRYAGIGVENLPPLFYTSCYNRAVDMLRYRSRRPEASLEWAADRPAPGDVGDALEEEEARRAALDAVDDWTSVAPRTRAAIEMRLRGDHSVPEIADALGMSEPSVKKAVMRGRLFLRERLADAAEGP